jgi:hypothetical protein
MKQSLFLLLLLTLVSWPVLAEEPVYEPPVVNPVDVPLDGTWCWNIKAPGMHRMFTKPTTRLRPDKAYLESEENLLHESMMALHEPLVESKPVPNHSPGFAVVGTGMEALKNAHDIWVRKEPVKLELPADTDLSLVIRTAGDHAELLSLTRDYFYSPKPEIGQFFVLKYQYPYFTTDTQRAITRPRVDWAGIALIPIGKLPVGKYEVRITRVEYTPKPDETLIPITHEMEETLICQPFAFKTVKHTIWRQYLGQSVPGSGSAAADFGEVIRAVPEPSAFVLCGIATILIGIRKSRKANTVQGDRCERRFAICESLYPC